MSKRTSPKSLAEREKRVEQAENLPRDVNRIVRLTLEVIFLLGIVVVPMLIWDGTIAVTPALKYGTYGFLIATGIAVVVGIAWRWLQKKVVFGRYSVEGLLAVREQEHKAHEAALKQARSEGDQQGRQAAEKRLGGELRAATQRAERAELLASTLEPKARRWDEEGAAAEKARRDLQRLTEAAQSAAAESAAALKRSREAEHLATGLLDTERHRRRSRVERMLRLRGRLLRVRKENTELRSELAAANKLVQDGQDAVERATASLRETLAARDQSITELKATEVALRREVETAHESAAEAWNQIGEHQRVAKAAQELMVRAIQAIEQILQVKKRERFLPADKTAHQVAEHFESLVKELAIAVEKLLREARELVLERQKEVQGRLETSVRELGTANRTLEREKRSLTGLLATSDASVTRLQDNVLGLERERTTLLEQLEALRLQIEQMQAQSAEALRGSEDQRMQLAAELNTATGEAAELRRENAEIRRAYAALEEAAAENTPRTPAVVQAMERLVDIWDGDLEAPIQALQALGLDYDSESREWRGDNLSAIQQALILMGPTAARRIATYLKTADAAAGAFDIDDAAEGQVASMERAEFLCDAIREFVAAAVSRYSAVDWLLSLPPAERTAIVNANQASDWFVMLVIASYLAGRRKCRFILDTDAYYQVRDKLSPMIIACIGSTLRAEAHRNARATERITKLRITTMFYSPAVLRAVKVAGKLVGDMSAGTPAVANDPHNWSLWLSVVANPPDAETAELFTRAQKALMALWCLSPTELRELLIDSIGDGPFDAIRTTLSDGRKSVAGNAAAMMGFDPTFALAFAPTSRAEWSAVGSRASIYSIIELISLSHPSRGVGGSLGGKKVNKAFDPFQAVALEWMHAHNNDPSGKLSPHMRSQTLRLPEVNAKRVADLGAQFYATFAAARRERERAMAG